MKKRKKAIYIILIVFFSLCIAVSGTIIAVKLWPQKPDFDNYKNSSVSSVASEASAELPDNPINFSELKAQSNSVIGYIKVDGTVVDYPIMRSGEDQPENFYLDHDWLGKSKKAGSIYIQRYNDELFKDRCTIVYGHNMMNGSMFGTLKRFKNANFFNDNRHITVYTPGHIYTYEIISAFVYDDRHILNSFNFGHDDEFQNFINECIKPKSVTRRVLPDFIPTTNDRLVVLSTCTSVDSERYLVVGCLIDDTITKQ